MNDWVRGRRERSIKNIEDCDLDICTIAENNVAASPKPV